MTMTFSEILEWLLGVSDIKEIKQGYAVIISSTVVVIGWYFTRIGQAKSDRVKNTAGFVTVLRDKELADARQQIADIVNNRQEFVQGKTAQSLAMSKILAHLEYQSASVRLGLISESFIDKTERTFIHTVFRSCSKHVHKMRLERKSKTIYENLEMLYIRSFIGRMNPVIQLIELITGRPQFYLSLLDFKLKYFFSSEISIISTGTISWKIGSGQRNALPILRG